MAKSVYGKVRFGKTMRMLNTAHKVRGAGGLMMLSGGMLAGSAPLTGGLGLFAGGALSSVGLLTSVIGDIAVNGLGKAARQQRGVAMIVARSQRAKGAAASISRARQVLDRTAAARSMAASRKAVPRPAAGRRPAGERQGGDGSTEGYYRNQGGKRVFVQGYATPPGRSR